MLRRALGIAAGLGVAVCCVGVIEALSSRLYPLPPGIDYSDREAMGVAVAALPVGAFIGVLLAWTLAAWAGACTAVRVGRHAALGLIIGIVLLTAAVANMLAIPHPAWLWAAAVLAIPAATFAGMRMAAAAPSSPTEA